MNNSNNQSAFFKDIGSDIPASIVVFLVALPLCLGIALASGAPLFSGIIAGIVGGIVVGSLSGSQLSVSGPAAGLTIIVFTAISKLPAFEAFLLVVVLAGIFQVILGKLKAGIIGDFIPASVIKGMLTAIGIILIFKQLPHLVGFDSDFEGDEEFFQKDGHNTFSEIYYAFQATQIGAIAIGAVSILIQILWESKFIKSNKVLSLFPASLLVVFTGVALNEYFGKFLPEYYLSPAFMVSIPITSSVHEFGSLFTFPDVKYITNVNVWISAATIAIIASLESLLSLEAANKLDPYRRVAPANRELTAQGFGNIVSGLLGGIPVTAVIVRSSANINSGAKTKLSAILHGILLLICVAFIPSLLNKIPLSSLAAILIFVGYKLTKPDVFKEVYSKGIDQFLAFVITIVAILFTDLLIGIIIGVLFSFYFTIKSSYQSGVMIVNDENRYLVKFGQEVSFINKSYLRHSLEDIPDNSSLLIDSTKSRFIDKDIVEVVIEFARHASLKNIKIEIKEDNRSERDFFKGMVVNK